MLCNRGTELSTAVHQTLFPRRADVTHPQLCESGSEYETALHTRVNVTLLDLKVRSGSRILGKGGQINISTSGEGTGGVRPLP